MNVASGSAATLYDLLNSSNRQHYVEIEYEEKIFLTSRAEINAVHYQAKAVMVHRMLLGEIPELFKVANIVQIRTK